MGAVRGNRDRHPRVRRRRAGLPREPGARHRLNWPPGWAGAPALRHRSPTSPEAPMDQPADPKRRRMLIAAIAGGFALLAAVGVGIYGLVRGPGDSTTDPSPSGTVTVAPTAPANSPTAPTRLPVTGDAEEYSRAVATELFTWDTL